MKDKIIQIIDDHIEAYGEGDSDHVGITEKSVQSAAEAIAQLMCDEIAGTLRAFIDGKYWEDDIIIDLEGNGFTKEQITKSLNDIKQATQ